MDPKDAIAKVIEGFSNGTFIRSIENDSDPGWALRLFPYIQALGTLERVIEELQALATARKHICEFLFAIDSGYLGLEESQRESAFIESLRTIANECGYKPPPPRPRKVHRG